MNCPKTLPHSIPLFVGDLSPSIRLRLSNVGVSLSELRYRQRLKKIKVGTIPYLRSILYQLFHYELSDEITTLPVDQVDQLHDILRHIMGRRIR